MFHDTELDGRKMLVREDREEGKSQRRCAKEGTADIAKGS